MMRLRRLHRKDQPSSASVPSAHIVLTIRVHCEDDFYVGEAFELGVSSFGESLEESLRMTLDAVCTHLNTMEELGTTREFLAEHGVEIHLGAPGIDHHDLVNVNARVGEIVSPRAVPLPLAFA